ncbi:long-chain-fatty-acid--CoA ligase [Lichenifustis flavocetrariae]|uniref:3-methylmercaptopropionyl-CoA ligase n=1 Tax=Lichenifustis flavocetrariae TaxID=2949735 RepID=A0AA41YT45_9HYPH|nr:long-chain-fatty-acid--CoA ligase [Lichenifustis flavocetrariae]MCW6508114.1 long-chain-fatty-acid--CoA ligase [Lichenifustis flavocetrariae]
MFGLIQDWPLRLHRILDYAAEQFPEQDVVSRHADGQTSRTSYAALRCRALQVTQRLRQDGIASGDRVATLAWNSARHMEVWFGATGLGAVYHTVNPRLFPEQILWIINHARDRIVFVESMFLPIIARLIDRLPCLERVIVIGDETTGAALPRLIGYEEWLAEADAAAEWTEGDERDAAGLCYTSGTTGEPKGVLYSHRSTILHAMAVSSMNGMTIGAHSTVMPIVPMFHVNAWGLPFAAPMMGARLVMPGARLDGASVYELMEQEGVTLAAGVPTVWMGLIDHLRRNGLRLSTLRRLVVGGSACPRSLIEVFENEFGVEVCHAWGMTEMSPLGSVGSSKPVLDSLGPGSRLGHKEKQGYAPFGVEMKIVDDDGRRLPWDGTTFGRLAVRGWAVVSGYFEDDTAVLDPEGYFDTGDVATIDPHGYMQVVDRTKDLIKSGGEWISSIAIENLAVGHPDIAEAAVIGLPHPKWHERPLLVVVGRDGTAPDKDAVLSFLSGKIAHWWMPDDVQFVEELPHTATGKVSKKALRAMFNHYAFPTGGPPGREGEER